MADDKTTKTPEQPVTDSGPGKETPPAPPKEPEKVSVSPEPEKKTEPEVKNPQVSVYNFAEIMKEKKVEERAAAPSGEKPAPAKTEKPEKQPEAPKKAEEKPKEPEQPKRRGRPPKADKNKAATPKPEAPAQKPENEVKKEPEKKTAPTVQAAPAPKEPEKPKDAPRRGKEQIVYIKLNELHAFKNHPFEVRDDEEMRAMVSSVKDKGVTQPAILSLMELIVGGKDGLQPVERTVIDRCVRQMYREHLQDPETSKMPTLQTLYDLLCSQPEGEAVRLATALEIYVSGSLNVFNHETNVDLNRRLVCLDLKKLGAGLRTIAMLIMQDLVNSQVSMNFLRGIATWCYFDEFHVLLRDRLTASYCVAIWKMLRKKGCVPSALTQNVKDFLASPEIENIFENSDFLVLLSQAQGDRQILAKQLGISPHQLSYVTHTNSGEGLLFFGNTTIPFVDRFPQNTELYAIMTTRPEDKKQEMNRA